MADLNYTVGIEANGAQATLAKLNKQVEQINSSFGLMQKAIGALAITSLISQVMSFGDQLSDTAQAFGATTAEVLALSSALDMAGGKGDNATKIFQGIATSIDELNSGNLKTLKSFQDLGISLSDLGQMTESEIRNKVIIQLGEMTNKTEAAVLAFKMFGKAAIGVDFTKLADEIKRNKEESEKYGSALNDAGAAMDALQHLTKQIKIAFAEAFNPVFKMLANIHVSTNDITESFKLMIKILVPVVVAITAVKAAIIACEIAMIAFNAASNLNPWVLGAKVIIAGLVAAGMAIASNTTEQEASTKETTKTADATKINVVNTAELNNKLKQQRDELMRIGKEYKNNTDALNSQYNLLLSSQRLSAVDYQQSKALNDLQLKFTNDLRAAKEQFDKLDVDSQNRQRQAYYDNVKAINDQYDIQRQLTAAQVLSAQVIKSQTDSQLTNANINVDSMKTMAKMRSDASELVMTTKERAAQEYSIKAQLEAISVLQKEINNSAFLTTEEKKEYLDTLTRINSLEGASRLAKDLELKTHTNIVDQIDRQNVALSQQSQLSQKILEQSKSFSAGWTQAFNKYVDDATNAAMKAQNIFNAVTNSMESAIDKFVDTGKFSFDDFAQSLIKDMIKIELKASAMNLMKMMGGAGGGGGGWLSAIGSVLGFADGGNPPIGRASIVGENGPEMIVPRTASTVIPMNAGGQQVTNNYYTVNAVDAKSVAQLFAENRKTLLGSIKMAEKEMPYRMR